MFPFVFLQVIIRSLILTLFGRFPSCLRNVDQVLLMFIHFVFLILLGRLWEFFEIVYFFCLSFWFSFIYRFWCCWGGCGSDSEFFFPFVFIEFFCIIDVDIAWMAVGVSLVSSCTVSISLRFDSFSMVSFVFLDFLDCLLFLFLVCVHLLHVFDWLSL